ncbi:hypothetical protein NM208_g170 [Fusarium decemcellulare]|uniref:Uncharacterized protein n=1 Tax=Fusarium decemcellulare TaxID=57161 RepID=A0ACC1T0J1_9HYPO|nr:hypothetical protein NM208_g170 [Fusarium decemcellulare]
MVLVTLSEEDTVNVEIVPWGRRVEVIGGDGYDTMTSIDASSPREGPGSGVGADLGGWNAMRGVHAQVDVAFSARAARPGFQGDVGCPMAVLTVHEGRKYRLLLLVFAA